MPSTSTRKKMSRLSIQDYIGIQVSDIHLSDDPPICRKGPHWFSVQKGYLRELLDLEKFLKVPVFCTGDIFNIHNPSPELINLAIDYLPENMSSVPGNHDLFFHSLDHLEKTGYGVLVSADRIENIPYYHKPTHEMEELKQSPFVKNTRDGAFVVSGFPYSTKVYQNIYEHATFSWSIAVIHGYIWRKESDAYHKATEKSNLQSWKKRIKGYDYVLFGDNHKGFICNSGTGHCQNLCNAGTFMRRTVSEIDYRPFLGLLRKDGNIERYELQSCNGDAFHNKTNSRNKEGNQKLIKFGRDLAKLCVANFDFRDALIKMVKSEKRSIRKECLKALNEAIALGKFFGRC